MAPRAIPAPNTTAASHLGKPKALQALLKMEEEHHRGSKVQTVGAKQKLQQMVTAPFQKPEIDDVSLKRLND